jgi:hypothetical protein
VRWPPDHPAVVDEPLARHRAAADRLCPEAEVVRVLRHVAGRRVATLVQPPTGGQAVLKIFASPRARGNDRRLRALREHGADDVVPRPLAVDATGHVGVVEFVAGAPLDTVPASGLADATLLVGRALRRLHETRAVLDRSWTLEDELAQLRRTCGPRSRPRVEALLRRVHDPLADGLVPSHRDCYPAQAIATAAGVRFIDLDDAAMAPPGLDMGNYLAHLDKDAAMGVRGADAVAAAIAALLRGYGAEPRGLEAWRRLSLLRLVALAETRHGDLHQMRLLTDRLSS